MDHFDFDSINTARELCRTRGVLNTEVTRKEIAYSWVRSQLNNVDYKELDLSLFPDYSKGCYLIDCDELNDYYDAILFVDISGKIIENFTKKSEFFLPKGMSLEEKTVGTNGIAMAVNTGIAQVTYHFENYHDYFDRWTIVGVPHYKEEEIDFYIGGIVKDLIFEKEQLIEKLKEISLKILCGTKRKDLKKQSANFSNIEPDEIENQYENRNTANQKSDLFQYRKSDEADKQNNSNRIGSSNDDESFEESAQFKIINDREHSKKTLQSDRSNNIDRVSRTFDFENAKDITRIRKLFQQKYQDENKLKNEAFYFENHNSTPSKNYLSESQYQNTHEFNISDSNDKSQNLTISEKVEIQNQNKKQHQNKNHNHNHNNDIDKYQIMRDEIVIENLKENQRKSQTDIKNSRFSDDDFLPDCTEKLVALNSKIKTLSSLNSPILILGHEGTGKEIFARKLHDQKYSNGEKFVTVYCDKITRIGFDEVLDQITHSATPFHGTVYFENFYCLSGEQQDELIRILDFKLINSDDVQALQLQGYNFIFSSEILFKELKGSKFVKTGLLNRIEMISVTLPDLNQIKDAMGEIIECIKDKHTQRLGIQPVAFDDELRRFLIGRKWPGNLRELDHFIETVLHENKGQNIFRIKNIRYYGENLLDVTNQAPLMTVCDAEKRTIEDALHSTDWNILKASKLLEISRSTLYRKMDKYQIKR